MLTALFIIFYHVSMGVHERIRQFAVLRAVALTRQQIAGIIFFESLLLGLLGWAGGLLAGWSLFSLAKEWKPELFQGGESLERGALFCRDFARSVELWPRRFCRPGARRASAR